MDTLIQNEINFKSSLL